MTPPLQFNIGDTVAHIERVGETEEANLYIAGQHVCNCLWNDRYNLQGRLQLVIREHKTNQ